MVRRPGIGRKYCDRVTLAYVCLPLFLHPIPTPIRKFGHVKGFDALNYRSMGGSTK